VLRDKPEIALFLELGLDSLHAAAGRAADRLDEQALADPELDADVVWTQLGVA
jgi:hypothetical protein